MPHAKSLNEAQAILLAVEFITEADFRQLQLLAAEQRSVLTSSLLYRQLLTYLPADPEHIPNLVLFLTHLEDDFKDISNLDGSIDSGWVETFSVQEGQAKLSELRLEPRETFDDEVYDDELSEFIIQWLRKLESLSGISPTVTELVLPFSSVRPKLQLWQTSYLLPLMRLQNEFYPGRAESLDTRILQALNGLSGVHSLLQFAEQDGEQAHIGRDLNEVVAPWVRGASQSKRRKLSDPTGTPNRNPWGDVNEWIFTTSQSNLHLAVQTFLEWDGPTEDHFNDKRSDTVPIIDVLQAYVQTGIATVIASKQSGIEAHYLLQRLVHRLAAIHTPVAQNQPSSSAHNILDASKGDLAETTMLQPTNKITFPSEDVFNLLENCLSAQKILEDFKISLPMTTIVDITLFGSEERQKQELFRVLNQVPRLTKSETSWSVVRQEIHILMLGQVSDMPSQNLLPHFLGRVTLSHLEAEVLDALIANGQYSTVSDIYLGSSDTPLSHEIVREHIVSAIFTAYDNASNGNRTRGGMKRACDMLKAFQPQFRSADIFRQIEHLIRATHSLSFYQLTLQHGVPFQPATIRIHHDPLSLLEDVLAQNHKAFTKLDDLLEIGRDLVQADLPVSKDSSEASKPLEERLFDAQHRITYLAITSALSDHDFDTAYSYITTRLATTPSQSSNSHFTDDTSWRAAYAAGKYRPQESPKSLHVRISGLSKRMDLLSLALTLTPDPHSLSEILATWRRCEEEMGSLRSQAVAEERAVDSHAHNGSVLPGGFAEDREIDAAETRRMMERRALGGSGPSYEEDAPMGLFDVARGAASAFRKSAFPLRGSGGQNIASKRTEIEDQSPRDSLDEPRSSGEYQRVRKRDMVSNMVTGGLVSGMSWVLGAPPAKQTDEKS